MIEAVKKGDTVVTAGGIVGKAVTRSMQTRMDVEIASGVRVKVIKSTLTDVQPLGIAKPAND